MHRHLRRSINRIGVPRGVLRLTVLHILKRKPLSGIELMDEIERYTDWRPSPGSIYPLLAHLKAEGMIEPYPNGDPSFKSFSLTKRGIDILETHKRYDKQLSKSYKSIRKIYWRLHREMPEEVYNRYAELVSMVEETYSLIKSKPEAIQYLKEILQEATGKLKKLSE